MKSESGKTKVQQHAAFFRLFQIGKILIRKCATRSSVETYENKIMTSQWKYIVMSLVACLPKHVYVDV